MCQLRQYRGPYGDVVTELDASVGRILGALKRYGLDRRTLVFFLSDNGPWLNFGNHAGSAGPLREGKGTEWEGGVRVPCVARWPGKLRPGSVRSDMAASMDILPTLAAVAGTRLPGRTIDGLNLLPFLLGDAKVTPREVFYYYYGTDLHAVRRGRWKLHVPHAYPSYEGMEPGNDGFPGQTVRRETGYALFDLESDIGERTNLVERYPEIVESLKAVAEAAREELGDGSRPGRPSPDSLTGSGVLVYYLPRPVPGP